ncbi:dimethylallyl tryptophan synthase protein [Rutstroemia sp. NJR-2017a BVV2]|nr:dimethylallyl tryptophan synthase protein [Rutstroemia sp. NJR-2017a BVV2]
MSLYESHVQVFSQPHLHEHRLLNQVKNQDASNIRPQTYGLGDSSAWDTLAKWLPYQNANTDWWWKTTGKQVQVVLENAGYSVSQQYEILLFHYWAVVPRLGPQPSSIHPQWRSFMTDDFSPIEYSWKWGMGSDKPEVRYGIEALSPHPGGKTDPWNQTPTHELLYQLNATMPGLDLSWYHHFKNFLFNPGTIAASTKKQGDSSLFLAFEMVRGQISVKAYFIPVETPERSVADQIFAAIKAAPSSNLEAIHQMESYLKQNPESSSLKPFMIGIDCVSPSKSRLKVYVRSPRTSFNFVRNVMTLGGLRSGLDDGLDQFDDLWKLTLGLESNYSRDEDLPNRHHTTSGTCFYFDVAPKSSVPDVKAYIPVRHYARSDRQVGKGLTRFLEKHGRAHFAQGYSNVVESLATTAGTDATTGVQTYISCAYQQGQISMTSYLSPQIYHPARWSPSVRESLK